ncbi:MAG TPA: hypothetical protein VGN05_02785, partial [Parvibaculum sp.]
MTKVPHETGWGISWDEDDAPRDVQNFNLIGKSGMFWLVQSVGLHKAAEKLMKVQDGEVPLIVETPIALMLGGYAIETMLKGVIVEEGDDSAVPSPAAKKAQEFLPKSHDLQRLAEKAQLPIDDSDRMTLGELTKYVLWGGRYPIPLVPNGYVLPLVFAEALGISPLWDAYVSLYKKLHRLATPKIGRASVPKSNDLSSGSV